MSRATEVAVPRNQGFVVAADEALFTVEFDRLGVLADFERELLPGVQVGDLVSVSDASVERVDLGVWTQADIDRARSEGQRLASALGALAG